MIIQKCLLLRVATQFLTRTHHPKEHACLLTLLKSTRPDNCVYSKSQSKWHARFHVRLLQGNPSGMIGFMFGCCREIQVACSVSCSVVAGKSNGDFVKVKERLNRPSLLGFAAGLGGGSAHSHDGDRMSTATVPVLFSVNVSLAAR